MFLIFRFAKLVLATTLFLIALKHSGFLPTATKFMAEKAKEAFETGTISYSKFNDKLIRRD